MFLLQAINGYFSLTHAAFAPPDNIMQENKTVSQWREEFTQRSQNLSNKQSHYAGYAYDAVWMYALALDKLAKEVPSAMSNIHNKSHTKLVITSDYTYNFKQFYLFQVVFNLIFWLSLSLSG